MDALRACTFIHISRDPARGSPEAGSDERYVTFQRERFATRQFYCRFKGGGAAIASDHCRRLLMIRVLLGHVGGSLAGGEITRDNAAMTITGVALASGVAC